MTRTDVHAPKSLVTENYEYVGAFYHGAGSMASDWAKELVKKVVVSTTTAYHSGSQCDHCGAHIKYVAVLHHKPTGDHLAIGEICLDNRFSQATADFQRLRKAAELDRQAQKIKAAAAQFRIDHPEVEEIFESGRVYGVTFLQNLERNFNLYGSLFPNQISAGLRVAREQPEKARLAAERAAKAANEVKGSVNAGSKIGVRGKVTFLRQDMSDWGPVLKMRVECVKGDGSVYSLWGNAPKDLRLAGIEVGDYVRFVAKVVEKEPGFGFYSLPRHGKIESKGAVA